MNPRSGSRQAGGKYGDLIRATRREVAEEKKRPIAARIEWARLEEAVGLIFAGGFLLGLVATSLGALANLWALIAIGGAILALWLILLIVYFVVGFVRRKRS